MPDGDDVAGADEDMGFTALHPAALQFRRAQHDEQRVVVDLQLGPLMGAMGVFDRQIMQTEPRLDHAQHFLAGLQQSDPDELPGLFGRSRRVDTDGLIAMPADIEGTVNHHSHDLITLLALSLAGTGLRSWWIGQRLSSGGEGSGTVD